MQGDEGREGAAPQTLPQEAGQAATTRFGMEEGDNTDTPATGGPTAEEEEARE